jgi:CubicO group peptidase (beta-lactamase class C family)
MWRPARGSLLTGVVACLVTLACHFIEAWRVSAHAVGADGQALGAGSITPELAQRIDSVFAQWDNARSPGCALGVGRNGAVVYSRGYGMANLEHDVPIATGSVFNVGSISKQFTAFSIGLLASDGKLALDDDVRRYVNELPDYGQRITIRHLLTHTSGLRDAYKLLGLAGWRVGQGRYQASRLQEPVTADDELRMAARQKSLDFAPGAEYVYNNAGYTLLAIIVERVSRQSLREFAEERIFRPLGMSNTRFLDDPMTIVRGRVSAYQSQPGNQWRIHVPVSPVVGPTGLYTTVGDLLKWEENFVHARAGGRALVDQMQTAQRLNDGRILTYGFGINMFTYRGVRRVGHGGDDFGYMSEAYRFPDQHVAIAVLCNFDTAPILIPRLADILLGDMLAAPSAGTPAVSIAEAELSDLAGTYWSPSSPVMRLAMKNGHLSTTAGELLTPLGGGRFRVGNRPYDVLFPPPQPGTPRQFHVLMPGFVSVLVRTTAPSYSAAQLKAYAGEYRSDELDVAYTIAPDDADGHLMLVRQRVDPVRLTALMPDTFLLRESLGDAIRFVRATAGEVAGFEIMGDTPRHLWFSRVDSTLSSGK